MGIFKKIFLLLTVLIMTGWSISLPELFVIGDSISIDYGPYLENYLQGIALYGRKQDEGKANNNSDYPTGTNGGDSGMVLKYLLYKLNNTGFRPDYLLLNCGLHDIKRNAATNEVQVTEKEYRKNLETIFKLLKKKNIQLIWIRTSPVVDSIHNAGSRSYYRYAADVDTYNRIADEICRKHNVPAIDLFSFSKQLGEDQFKDHVHYKEPACALQAAFIAGAVQTILNSNE